MLTTVGQILVNEALPEKYRDYNRQMGASEAKAVLTRMAFEDPQLSRETSNKLVMLGARASFDEGVTLSISDTLNPVKDRSEMFKYLRAQKARILASNATQEEKDRAIEALNDKVRVYLTDAAYNEGLKAQNPFALQVASKARGSPAQLVSLQTSPGTYTDTNGRQIPIFIEHSFAEGLSPMEYWAGTYGARKSVTCLSIDTEVRMGDYSSKAIKDVKPGDVVLGSDSEGVTKPVKVVRVYDNGTQPVYRFVFRGPLDYRPHVDATEEHKMLVRSNDEQYGKLVRLGDAAVDDGSYKVLLASGLRRECPGCVLESKQFLGNLPVMDIEVDSPDHMFVLANGLVSANSTKFATRDAGALGKQFNRAVMRLVVADEDCGTNAGIPVKPDDIDNLGSVLSSDAPPYKAGTVVTKEVMQDLKDKYDEILVRSPLTCGCKEGLCAKCAGIRETGKFPEIGSHVGLQASSALAERIAQGSLNTKHSSGVSQGKGKVDDGDTYAGFDIIDQLFQVPKEFPHRAAVASVTGNVESVEPAPQGGWNIVVNGKTHYAISETRPRCKVGDYVEAGDQLSTGLMNPADVVKYKGIGEGRRYLMNRATKAYKDSGYAVNRRNMEVLVRGFLDNVRVNGNEGLGDFLPDDVVSYSALASTYRPRQDSKTSPVNAAIGSYLEEPVMHYTIGTRITRNVANQLKKHGHSNVFVNPNPPGFEPEATPLKLVSRNEKDWVDQLGGTYLKSNILNAAHRGATSEIHSLQPEHAMARGVELGNPPPASQFGKKWVY